MNGKGIAWLIKKISGFAVQRSMPALYKTTLKRWYTKHKKQIGGHDINKPISKRKRVYLFCDEFTNYNDTAIGIKAILLLEKLGYEVIIPDHIESGRTWLSKGLVRKAKKIANENIRLLHSLITPETPLIGIEPSAILTFRDEYVDLANDQHLVEARNLASHVFLIDEFIAREIEKGHITGENFTKEKRTIKLHGHCQQKALSSVMHSHRLLTLPQNYKVEIIPVGLLRNGRIIRL
jgi:Fe-S oxidoreductase